jgi:membrane protein
MNLKPGLPSTISKIPVPELVKRIYEEIGRDRCFGRAAELGFYFILSLFPMLIFVLTLLSFFPDTDQLLLLYLARLIPSQALNLIDSWAQDLLKSRSSGLLSFGVLFTLWSASTGMIALMRALNAAYEVPEGRPFFKARLVAVVLVFALSVLFLGGTALVFFGDLLLAWIFQSISLRGMENIGAQLTRYCTGLLMLYGGFNVIYTFGPNIAYKPKWLNAGSIFATISCLIASFLFSVYLRLMPSMNKTYGSLGAFIALMLWTFLFSAVIMIGAEINSEVEKTRGQKQEPREPPGGPA